MAIDNLNFYSNWLPAGQLTDRYSSQPWCLRSKNLDIFSSSKSVKATAWSQATQTDADVIKQDWVLLLKTDWKVYERTANGDVLVVDPSVNFPVYKVSYSWKNGTFADAQWGTVQDMVAKYEWDEWKSFVVYTDRASYLYSDNKITFAKSFASHSGFTDPELASDWYAFEKNGIASNTWSIYIEVDARFSSFPIRIRATWDSAAGNESHIALDSIKYVRYPDWYYYEPKDDMMEAKWWTTTDIAWSGDITSTDGILLTVPSFPYNWSTGFIRIDFTWTLIPWYTDRKWLWRVYIDINWWPEESHRMTIDNQVVDWDTNYYYSYLPLRNRKLEEIWEYAYSQSYWMKGTTFQPLYKWVWSWIDVNWENKLVYDFTTDMWWESDPAMDVIWLMVRNEEVYMIGNLEWNWYIIPCDLTWGRWTPYIAYGCEFKWATNIDYLMYLVWDDRWVSQLWVYNGQELVSILGWNEEKDTKNLINTAEQYKFDWKMVNYRKNLVLSTSDNRIFAYGQTYWGKWGAFIHKLPWNITKMVSKDKNLVVEYEVSSTKYLTFLQDDTPIKYYNTEWMAEYPIVVGNHLLEKEESDLYASYILPSSSCKLEFWGMANHYHFWTFISSDNYTFDPTASYKMKGCTGSYALKFIEKNDNQYTFKLEWDLPIQNWEDMKITDTQGNELVTYTEYNHFRKIWEITTTEYKEWEFRFHNLNNKLDLPKSHSLQIMVKGKGTTTHTPELFALDLVANQRDRW